LQITVLTAAIVFVALSRRHLPIHQFTTACMALWWLHGVWNVVAHDCCRCITSVLQLFTTDSQKSSTKSVFKIHGLFN